MCAVCLAIARSPAAARRRTYEECPGVCPHLASIVEDREQKQHALWAFVHQGLTGLFCTTCGAFSTHRADNLKLTCIKRPHSKRGAESIRRFLRGEHPYPRGASAVLDGAWQLDGASFAAVDCDDVQRCSDIAERMAV